MVKTPLIMEKHNFSWLNTFFHGKTTMFHGKSTIFHGESPIFRGKTQVKHR